MVSFIGSCRGSNRDLCLYRFYAPSGVFLLRLPRVLFGLIVGFLQRLAWGIYAGFFGGCRIRSGPLQGVFSGSFPLVHVLLSKP